MTCNLCGVNEATIHLTEIINNQMIEIHICETCAQDKGTDFKTHFNVSDIFAGIEDLGKAPKGAEKLLQETCPQCGLKYEEFGKAGRLGCATCYEAFAKVLLPLIKRVQRTTQHVGKKPSKIPTSTRSAYDLRLLQERLRKSIQNEAFEEAAQLRDEIKQLEEKAKKPKKSKS